jgi:transcriptional regulator with XRE-family HTH domain
MPSFAHRVEPCRLTRGEPGDVRQMSGRPHAAPVDDQRVGRIVRALRRRLGWRQLDVAERAGCSQTKVSLLERGHLSDVPLTTLRAIIGALDASLAIEVRWRAGALERLLDEDHAVLVGRCAEILRRAGWLVEVEVTYSEWGERGSYDILAYHLASRTLLVVEVKTDITSAEATLRKLDEKVRLAQPVAQKRFGWSGDTVGRLLVLAGSSTLRRRVARHRAIFDRSLPTRAVDVRRWIMSPVGGLAGLWFLSTSRSTTLIKGRGGRERIRRPKSQSDGRQATE